MNTSPKTSTLSKPTSEERIPIGTLAYFRSRNRWRLYDLVISEFQKSGISKATLARRLGKRPEVVTRLLGAPGNWSEDTVSDLLFAISGAEPNYGVQYPLSGPPRNLRQPDWLQEPRQRNSNGKSSASSVGAGAAGGVFIRQ